jgi:hypothetical protein
MHGSKFATEFKKGLKMQNSYTSLVANLQAHKAAKTDLAKCIDTGNLQYGFTQSTANYAEKMGIDLTPLFSSSTGQKQIMRCIQFLNALESKVYKNLDFTHARVLCAMRLAGSYDLTYDAIIALCAGVRSGTANTRGISYSVLNKMSASKHGLNTVSTKVSNSVGANGFYQVLGLTFGAPGTVNRTVSLNDSHPLVTRFFEVINSATVGQLDEMTGGKAD